MAEFQVTTPEGRIVQGHPVDRQPVLDDNRQPVMENGVAKTQTFFALAIPKGGEQSWQQTPWGSQVVAAAKDPENGYPNGEWQRPDFSWKVEDGDSTIPNKNGIANNTREGFPGHWIIKCSTNFDVPCFPAGNVTDDARYNAVTKISDPENYPKTGDYIQVALRLKGNKPAKSPGVYMNPIATIRTRPGAEISTGGTVTANEAAALFAATPAPTQAVATPPPAPTQSTTPPPPAPPAHDLVNTPPAPPAPVIWTYDSRSMTQDEWIAQGWSLEQLQAHAVKS